MQTSGNASFYEGLEGLLPLILRLVAEYQASKEIATSLFVTVRAVDRHRANIAAKLGLAGSSALLHNSVHTEAQTVTRAVNLSIRGLGL